MYGATFVNGHVYNLDFDINEVPSFAHLWGSNLYRLLKGGLSFEHRLLNVVFRQKSTLNKLNGR